MLIRYDAKNQVWIASCLVDNEPVMCISRNMATAMHLLAVAATAEPLVIEADNNKLVQLNDMA